MKKILTFLFTIIILSSCKNEKSIGISTQTWKLIKMTGRANPELTGNKMFWQEIYQLNKDSSFIKTRVSQTSTLTASGTYTIETIDAQNYFVFKYPTQNELIGSCNSSSLKEYLNIQSNNYMFSTWQACDGPGLEYQRTQ